MGKNMGSVSDPGPVRATRSSPTLPERRQGRSHRNWSSVAIRCERTAPAPRANAILKICNEAIHWPMTDRHLPRSRTLADSRLSRAHHGPIRHSNMFRACGNWSGRSNSGTSGNTMNTSDRGVS